MNKLLIYLIFCCVLYEYRHRITRIHLNDLTHTYPKLIAVYGLSVLKYEIVHVEVYLWSMKKIYYDSDKQIS